MSAIGAVSLLACGAETAPDETAADQTAQAEGTKDPPGGARVTAEALLAKLGSCATKVSRSPYAMDVGARAKTDVCKRGGAIYFTADMDIDCDGKSSEACNKRADPTYQGSTAGVDSSGKPLDAARIPYVVVPGVSARWSYRSAGIEMGSVALVIYDGKIEYGVVGDVGPASILGEASYAMAKSLGIDPDPARGGAASGVTYVIFPNATVSRLEDHAAAVAAGEVEARKLLGL
jgi:hypothetical protein